MRFLWSRMQIALMRLGVFWGSFFYPSLFSSYSSSFPYFLYQVFSGVANNTWEQIDFGKISKRVTIITNADVLVMFSYDDTGYEDVITVPGGEPRDYRVRARHVRIRNETPGTSVNFQLIAWYIVAKEV